MIRRIGGLSISVAGTAASVDDPRVVSSDIRCRIRSLIPHVRYRRYGGVHSATKPLFRVDPGWLFILAGLFVCAAGVILPAQNDLQSLRNQLEQLRSEEVHAYARLKAHSDFMDQ